MTAGGDPVDTLGARNLEVRTRSLEPTIFWLR